MDCGMELAALVLLLRMSGAVSPLPVYALWYEQRQIYLCIYLIYWKVVYRRLLEM